MAGLGRPDRVAAVRKESDLNTNLEEPKEVDWEAKRDGSK